jgi:hypothetical protein
MPFGGDTGVYHIEDIHCPDWLSVQCAGLQKKGSVHVAQLVVSGNVPDFSGEIAETIQFQG